MIEYKESATLSVGRTVISQGRVPVVLEAAGKFYSPARFGRDFGNDVALTLGIHFARFFRQNVRSQQFPQSVKPLEPYTVAAKAASGMRSPSAPWLAWETLSDDQHLEIRRLAQSRVVVRFKGSASKHPASSRAASPAGLVAVSVEQGVRIKVTRKMQRFLSARVREDGWPELFKHLRVGQILNVPGRPVYFPSLRAFDTQSKFLVARALVNAFTSAKARGLIP